MPEADSTEPPWFVSAFDADYVQRYAHRDAAEAARQVSFLAERGYLCPGDRVLDLCCGAGRHLAHLAAAGTAAFGTDLSPALLAAARAAGRPLVRSDMRRLPFGRATFDAVIQMFTAFGYFEDDGDNRAVLAEVARVLEPGGRYTLDLMNRAPTIAALAPLTRRSAGDLVIEEHRRYDPIRRRIEKAIHARSPDGAVATRRESVRVFDRAELERWLAEHGLAAAAWFGDFAGASYDGATSPRMIAVARRR